MFRSGNAAERYLHVYSDGGADVADAFGSLEGSGAASCFMLLHGGRPDEKRDTAVAHLLHGVTKCRENSYGI
jgi:hypothetical protein